MNALEHENPLLNAALGYAKQGWRVLPLHSFADGHCTCDTPNCDSPAKHPLTLRGVHDATTDEAIIRRWWSEAPTANVGIATGDGLLVLDVDAKSGGLESWAMLEKQHGPLPSTPTVNTGGGGGHYYLSSAPESKIGNKAGIAPGIDIRGENGYVVAPPSLHASGRSYEWASPPETHQGTTPSWLLDMLSNRQTTTPPKAEHTGMVLKVRAEPDDLTTHAGVGKGQRNAVLCKLIGVHLARGEDANTVEPLALTWAKKCTPPLSDMEVLRSLTSLVSKHQRTVTATVMSNDGGDDIDLLPLPAAPRWPGLHPDAHCGLAGELVDLLGPNTEADPNGLLLTFLACFGSVVGRAPYFAVEGDRHHGNLFVVLVGDTSKGRKGTSLGRILSLFEPVDPYWKANCISTGLSSGEGLIHAVRDPVETTDPVKEKGKVIGYQPVIRDQGVADKRLLVTEPEFAQSLKVMRREGNTLSPVLRQAWDSGSLAVLTKNNSSRATNAHITILGHITRPELQKTLDDTDCWNGFANRILWVLVKRSKLLPEGGAGIDLGDFQKRLTKTVAKAQVIQHMSRSPQARLLWLDMYPHLSAERPGLFGAVTGRAEAQTLRLSMLYALLDGQAVIEEKHLKAASAVWQYCQDSAEIVFTGEAEPMEPLEKLLLEKIKAQPGTNRRGLHKIIGGHVPGDMLVKALAGLRDKGKAKEELRSTGGRPSECWFPVLTTTPMAQSTMAEPMQMVQQIPELPSPPSTPILTLMELFQAVNSIGGRLQRQGDRCVLLADADRITPGIAAALEQQQEELVALLPPAQA